MKRFIQLFSIVMVIAAFSIISANAQTVSRYEANIPFDFSVSGKTYEAGTYILRLAISPAGKVLSIEDAKSNKLQAVFVMERGEVAKSSQLTFTKGNNDEWTLAKILTADNGFAVAGAKAAKSTVAKNDNSRGSETETTTVNLK